MDPTREKRPRYRFGEFTVSPSRRVLLRSGKEVPLIPRYFDLLLLLVERRGEAIHRRDILDEVWSDVIVTDNALNQAVRALRRALGDDPREPVFIRTVARHGYRFIFGDIAEGADDGPLAETAPDRPASEPPPPVGPEEPESFEATLDQLLDESRAESERAEAAERLHALGTAEALRRLERLPGHESARALLRDSRWEVPGAGPVPLFGQPGGLTAARILVGLRLRRAVRLARSRWLSGVVGGGLAGLIAGLFGGLVLRFGPGAIATNAVMIALPLVGAVIGSLGAAGVGAGMAGAETLVRSFRGVAIVGFGALGGFTIGALAHALGGIAAEGLFGRDLSPFGGGFEGLVMGGATALGYALATPRSEGGMATPRGRARLMVAIVAGVCCAAAAVVLALTGSRLGAMSLDFMARSFPGSQVRLTPLARLIGEVEPGLLTASVISAYEGLLFGLGLVLGLTRRPRPQ